ncbi:hypothetical protein [Pseudoduganella violacea]|uniref:Uncharacterized protein n=1 Tax=Pseudoduganella violacea TaxID=1715466 RepID=A0A7W5FV02_9BURK|nr:hypothetical protein [Pseudoduganella violacea]MBB3120261.1 hypothetical protein [Pseudoduganella violacea]
MNTSRFPPDIYIPELDQKTMAEMDALHAEFVEDSKDYPPSEPRPLGLNLEAFRQLPPQTRAIFRYIWERHQREYEEFLAKKNAA